MITLKDVSKTYSDNKRTGSLTPVKGFNLHIENGHTAILSGPSGAGKSTLLNMIAGITKPTTGTVEVDGKIISKLPEHFSALYRRENIGMIFQKFYLIPGLTLLENVTVPMIPSVENYHDIHNRALQLLQILNIEDRANARAEVLSGGELQRGAIARALINKPKIILADEPTANLDKKLTEDFISIMKMLKSDNRTILIATHDESVIGCGLADMLVPVKKGE